MTYPSKKQSNPKGGKSRPSPETPAPASLGLDTATPLTTSTDGAPPDGNVQQDPSASAMEREIIRRTTTKPREDGGVLNCFSVSVYCFKLGRLTVPPVSPTFY